MQYALNPVLISSEQLLASIILSIYLLVYILFSAIML